mgnify:CR=1 FL=1
MRGLWYLLEVMLAIAIVIIFLLSVNGSILRPSPPEVTTAGYEILRGLDEQGNLRGFVSSGDTSGLESLIAISGYRHAVQFCFPGGACAGTRPSAENLYSADYLISGDEAFEPAQVILYIY